MSKKNNQVGKKIKKMIHGFSESNKMIFFISLCISFLIWVAVAMYASPEETAVIYNVPITINTENSLVGQNGYKTFWQSDDKIDVTITGPRYLVTSVTAEDLNVSAVLNNVDSAGVSDLSLKVALKSDSQDIRISSYSKKTISVYFDEEAVKTFDIKIDSDAVAEKLAEEYQLDSCEMTISKVSLKGPATEMKKIVDVVANPVLPEELLYETQTVPVGLSYEGANAADTVSINKYVELVEQQDFYAKINIDKLVQLTPQVEFEGTKTGDVSQKININTVIAKIDTEYNYTSDTLTILKVDYADLYEGVNRFSVKASELELPDGVTIPDQTFTFNIEVTYTAYTEN